MKKYALEFSLLLNVILGFALFFAISALLVVYGQKKQYENTFDQKMIFDKKECMKLNPCEPCEKAITKAEVKQEILMELNEGDILKSILSEEQYRELAPYLENNITSRE